MHISVSEAKAQLTDLVRRAEAGDEIILTRHGHAAVRLVPVVSKVDAATRMAVIAEVRAMAHLASPGPDAAHSQDWLYNENGLPA